jgi:two-component system, NarL family, response regulator LiaR
MVEGMPQDEATPLVRVALMNDYEVIVAGLHRMFAPYGSRVRVVELVSMLPVHSTVDVLLYDAFSRERVTGPVQEVINETDAKVAIYSWNFDPTVVQEALDKGAVAWLSKSLSAEELVAAVEKVHSGEVVVSEDPGSDAEIKQPDWPGKDHGLSARESEIIALIAQGLSNQEIAERAFLSINSVKTYIRSAYRKIGVQRRTQAVIWATRIGMTPNRSRTILGDP